MAVFHLYSTQGSRWWGCLVCWSRKPLLVTLFLRWSEELAEQENQQQKSLDFIFFLLVSLQIPGHQAASWKVDLYIFCGVLTSRPAQPGFCLVSGQQWNLRISYTSAYLLLFRTVWSAYLGCPSRMYHSPRPGVAQECGRKAEKKYFNFIITS